MKTRDLIKLTALKLMNRSGMPNVTLRHVAEEMGKSYGNITYHYPNKEMLVEEIYEDMLLEMSEISGAFNGSDILGMILEAPELTWEVSVRYLFLYKDYVEIRRTFPKLCKRIDKENRMRMEALKPLLKGLCSKGVLRKDLSDEDLDTIMLQSGWVRTWFFLELPDTSRLTVKHKAAYVKAVNAVIKPYLSSSYLKKYF